MQVPPFSLDQQLSEIGHDLDLVVSKVLRSGQYIGGEQVNVFEKSFAQSVGVPYSVGCNSGTDALILALRGLGIGPGDEVITASFSFFATAEAISNVGAKPVFIDVDLNNYLIDPKLIEKAITPATKAILPVHLFGRPVDMDAVISIANKNGLKVIEDCAQAAGAHWNGKPVGGIGDIGCFSFFPTKNLGAAGDGGAITTHDLELAQRIRELAVHGMPKRYFHTELGYNSRLDAIQAAILNVKLPKLPEWVEKRSEIALRYKKCLQGIPGLVTPDISFKRGESHSWNQFVVKVENIGINNKITSKDLVSYELNMSKDLPNSTCRDWLKDNLFENGVSTIIYYPIPIHLQPVYKQLGYKDCNLPHTEILSSQVLSLPIFPELTVNQQDHVVSTVISLLKK